ncbi:MAG: tetratricopeptide repeat protein [Deltaproteobacteria bacterium]|nr:tetratricopeptide repeat protein [Deltaproteobacteria bacterium]
MTQALEAEGREDEAFNAYIQALGMSPQNPWVNFRLGKIYFFQGNYDKAVVAFQKTLARVPHHLYALSSLIDIYEKEGKMNLAQKYRNIIG